MNFNLLDTLSYGLIVSQCCDSCPSCEYILGYADTYLKYVESFGFNYSCCNNYILRQNKYEDIKNNCVIYKPYDTNSMGMYVLNSWCNNGFSDCLVELESKIGTANFNTIVDKGLFEQDRTFSVNGICFILNYASELGIVGQNDIYNFVDNVLNLGIATKCVSDKLLMIGSVETFLKVAENLKLTNNPISNSSQNNLC